MIPYSARGGSCKEDLSLPPEETDSLEIHQSAPLAQLILSTKCGGGWWHPAVSHTPIGHNSLRLESCLGSKESFTGLLLERTIGVCHLIHPLI